jgi:hypothetical protein
MLAVNQLRAPLVDSLASGLLEVHRSKISLHHAKADYDYPTIRLPHYLSPLAGMSTRIFKPFTKERWLFSWSFCLQAQNQKTQQKAQKDQ